jgi:hypothetical protein
VQAQVVGPALVRLRERHQVIPTQVSKGSGQGTKL